MHTLFLTRRFYPQIGGVEKHVFELSKRLIAKGHKITIITENASHEKSVETYKDIKIYRLNVGKEDWFKKFRIWKSMWQLRKLIEQSEIVHCHDVFFWYLPFRFLMPRKKVFTTFHGYESYPIAKKAIVIRKLSEKLSSGNICVGDFIPKWYGTRPTYISYGAVNLSKENKEGRENINSAVFIGRLDEQTGILEYTKATEIIKKQIPDFKLTVIGDGKYKNKIGNNIKVLGFQKNPEKYFQKYHFAFVSRYLSIIEAMAAKRLVFALYDNQVKEDYLKMAPFAKWIIIEKDPQKLAQKAVYYLHHPQEEKKLIESAYQWTKKQSWEALTDIYLSLWKNMPPQNKTD